MGYYSHIEEENFTVKDGKGLMGFLLNPPAQIKDRYGVELHKVAMEILDGKDFNLRFLEDNKIIQYWYRETLILFDRLAQFIEGYLVLMGEDEREKAEVRFTEGEAIIINLERDFKEYHRTTAKEQFKLTNENGEDKQIL